MRYSINKTKYLTKDELDHLYRLLENNVTRDAILIALALKTGARAQELLNLTAKDLDDQNRTIYIRGLKNSKDREIPLDKEFYRLLKDMALKNEPDRIFNITYSGFVQIWKKWTPNRSKSLKSLRHTCAMNLYRASKDLLLVQSLLGHRYIENTMVYSEHEYETNQLKRILKYK